jgi:hypothetical protein
VIFQFVAQTETFTDMNLSILKELINVATTHIRKEVMHEENSPFVQEKQLKAKNI